MSAASSSTAPMPDPIKAANSKLFQPIKVGEVELKHRIAMAPLTRFRADEKGCHHEAAVEMYAQRASSGALLITEATFISPAAGGFDGAPGIWSEEQIEAWRKVTDAVHAKGAPISMQLWALGRAAKKEVLARSGHDVVSASDVPLSGSPALASAEEIAKGLGGHPTPRPLTVDEIKQYCKDYATAAKNAIRAGFDFVELHSAHGEFTIIEYCYLIDQFIQTMSNKRTDDYGGSIENRTRFAREALAAIVEAVGPTRVGIRLSPWSHFQDMRMDDPIPTFQYLIQKISDAHPNLAYIHLVEVAGDLAAKEAQRLGGIPTDANKFARDIWQPRPFFSGGGYTSNIPEAIRAADEDNVIVVFGRAFIANPDLPQRIQKGIPLNPYDRSTFYALGPKAIKGYTDYPFADEAKI